MTDLDDYRGWLRSLPRRGAYHALSPHRPYETAEEGYDRDAAPSLYAGELLTGMLSAVAPGLSGLCLEIGCGTGYLTCGLVDAGRFERYLVTDGSERSSISRGRSSRASAAWRRSISPSSMATTCARSPSTASP
jgi:hypothetical protein